MVVLCYKAAVAPDTPLDVDSRFPSASSPLQLFPSQVALPGTLYGGGTVRLQLGSTVDGSRLTGFETLPRTLNTLSRILCIIRGEKRSGYKS